MIRSGARHSIILAGIAGSLLALSCVSHGENPMPSREKPSPPPAKKLWLDANLPPMPYEAEALEAVWARFPDARPEEITSFLRSYFPVELRTFRMLAGRDKQKAVNFLAGIFQEAIRLMETRRRSPRQFELTMQKRKLEAEADRLALVLRNAKGNEKEKYTKHLNVILSRIFDIRHKIMQEDVDQMSHELDKLRKLIMMREKSRKAIVKRRFLDMTRETDHLEW